MFVHIGLLRVSRKYKVLKMKVDGWSLLFSLKRANLKKKPQDFVRGFHKDYVCLEYFSEKKGANDVPKKIGEYVL